MPDPEYKNSANQLLDEHPDLRSAMAQSKKFAELKSQSSLDEVAGQTVYLVNDTQGDEDTLYVDALAKGAKGLLKNKTTKEGNDIYHELYLELDDRLKAIVEEKIAGGDV
jgi:hypothetical protein